MLIIVFFGVQYKTEAGNANWNVISTRYEIIGLARSAIFFVGGGGGGWAFAPLYILFPLPRH